MLLIDGVKYELWTPPTEDEFEQVVKEHTQEIFGEKSIYFDRKQKLKSLAGIGSIPDGYALILGDVPHWHIVEVELSSHPLDQHIVSQVSKFIIGIKNPYTQREIALAMYTLYTEYAEVTRDGFLRLKVEQPIRANEIFKFLSDIISKQPTLTIIIEKDTEGLREAISTLRYPEIKVVEFQTFTREGIGLPVHAHLFEPLYKAIPQVEAKPQIKPTVGESFEVTLPPSCMKYYYIHVPVQKKHLFPNSKTSIELETDVGLIATGFNIDPAWGAWLQKGLSDWFKAHKELKAGDKIRFTVIEPMKKYRFETVR